MFNLVARLGDNPVEIIHVGNSDDFARHPECFFGRIVAEIAPGKPVEAMRQASRFFRDNGYQSRPTQVHGIDLVTDKPHVVAEHVAAEKFEEVLKAGMVIMAEPNPITADGMFGIFLGHTFIVTENGHEVVDKFPLEIAVAG